MKNQFKKVTTTLAVIAAAAAFTTATISAKACDGEKEKKPEQTEKK